MKRCSRCRGFASRNRQAPPPATRCNQTNFGWRIENRKSAFSLLLRAKGRCAPHVARAPNSHKKGGFRTLVLEENPLLLGRERITACTTLICLVGPKLVKPQTERMLLLYHHHTLQSLRKDDGTMSAPSKTQAVHDKPFYARKAID